MSNEKLYIPKKINVGFQLRQGTYTGKLAYVIYWDDKGKLRKEASWESWRHKPGEPKNRWARTDKKKELEEYESRLDKLVSPEVRERLELEAIQKGLGL